MATTPTPTAIITPQPTAKPEKPVAEQICERIKSLEERTSCLAAVKKDPNLCGPLSEYYKQPCLNRLLLTPTSEELCESFKENKPLCMAYARRDYTFCAEWVYSDYCYEGIAALTGNPTICNLISYEGYRKECKAVLTKDVTWCRGSDTEDCYQLLALLTGDEEVCERLWVEATDRVKEVRDLDLEVAKCIKMAAKDVTDCVQKSGTGVDCDAIPAVVGDASLCEKLRANTDACYFRTALRAAGVPLESLLL